MRSSLFISSLLPLLLLSIVSVPCLGQDDNPFGSGENDPARNPFDETSDAPPTKPGKRPKVDADALNVFLAREKQLKNELNELRSQNELLKALANELQDSVAELNRTAEEAAAVPEEMHQALFDSLLFSDDKSHQEFALKHLIACIEKHRTTKNSISLHSVDVHRRIKLLTGSETATVREMAAGCLYNFHPTRAMEIGIQFNSAWKPLEHARADINTRMVHDALARTYDLVYDETPLWEIVEELKTKYGINVRLADGIDADQSVTYESFGRTLTNSLAGLLKSKKLGFTVKDEEILIMKDTNPDLNVVATYNVSGLDSLAQIKTEAVLKLLKDAFPENEVEFAKVGEHMFTAKADFKNQQQIEERIATLMPRPKWYSR